MRHPIADGGGTAPIDIPILEYLEARLQTTAQVAQARISDVSGHRQLVVDFESAYYPRTIDEATLVIRWYTNEDFSIHYLETSPDSRWECRWDRHPNSHNARDHFHPPPDAATPGEDATWPNAHQDVLRLVLDDVETRINQLWEN